MTTIAGLADELGRNPADIAAILADIAALYGTHATFTGFTGPETHRVIDFALHPTADIDGLKPLQMRNHELTQTAESIVRLNSGRRLLRLPLSRCVHCRADIAWDAEHGWYHTDRARHMGYSDARGCADLARRAVPEGWAESGSLPLSNPHLSGRADRIVGAVEIAERCGVERDTVDKWRARHDFPQPGLTVGGRPAWRWSRVALWVSRTGRLPRWVAWLPEWPARGVLDREQEGR